MRLKAEWERQNLILMAFPNSQSDWKEDLEGARTPFFKLAQAIAYSQLVYLLVESVEEAKKYFCSTTNIIFIEAKFNDTWVRDYGPLSVEDGDKKILADLLFNGWGGKYRADLDTLVTRRVYIKKGYTVGVS